MADSNHMVYKRNIVPDIIIGTILTILALVTLLPFYNVFILSLAEYQDYVGKAVYLLPTRISFIAYQAIFSDSTILRAYGISTLVTISGTLLSMFCTTTAAYALSKKGIPGRNIMLNLVIFTMFFGGGLIPTYLLNVKLHLVNTLTILIISDVISTFNFVLMKNFFNDISPSMEESARIDGANDITILFRIVLPLSIPIIATISLFYAIGKWNDWFTAFLYINNPDINPIQIVLRKLVVEMDPKMGDVASSIFKSRTTVMPKSIRSAVIVVTALPILFVYVYIQKYFTKGIMIGSVKA